MHFCQQEMLVYSCSIKICALRFNKLLESIFWLLLVVEAFPLQKVLKMLKEVVVSWQEVRWTWQMRQNFVAQFVQLLKCWATCGRVSLWRTIRPFLLTTASCRHCSFWCISSICWAYFSGVMVFDGIQKTLVDQISSSPPNSGHGSFCGAGLALGSALELLLGPATKLVIASCRIQSTFCCTWQSNWEMVCCCCIE